MKVVLILLFASYAVASKEIQNVRGPIEDIAEKIRKIIPEPIEVDKFDLVIPDNVLVSGSANVTNFTASGLKAFTFKFKMLPPGIKIGLQAFSLDTKYAVDLPLLRIPLLSIFGNGNIRIALSNLNIDAGINPFGLNGKTPIASLSLDIQKIEFSISGFFDDDTLSQEISKFLETYVLQTFEKNKKAISEFLKTVMNKIMYAFMHRNATLTVDEVADIAYKSGSSLSFSEALNHIFTTAI
ncbi:unnamed protein product [Callosobruchus maculatus]|uniref:Lipid-binding serum glycoprotein N-terminal domain-containing protein n=1 Tax=Callosobruchus maculatus TaxID=64391 RepID=A0A653CYW7_CALMS|nr:unnamed protein product [Callosobruchus maculatus]